MFANQFHLFDIQSPIKKKGKHSGVNLNVEQTSENCPVDDSPLGNMSGENEDVEIVGPSTLNAKNEKNQVPDLTSSKAINEIQGKIVSFI